VGSRRLEAYEKLRHTMPPKESPSPRGTYVPKVRGKLKKNGRRRPERRKIRGRRKCGDRLRRESMRENHFSFKWKVCRRGERAPTKKDSQTRLDDREKKYSRTI